uniref:Uncharacterized protein n=1 Tax=Salarias fasciatus TaxID=181472 RepID=A0A672GZ63_SALFA
MVQVRESGPGTGASGVLRLCCVSSPGGPGSGKGGQAARLGPALGLDSVSLDDLLRTRLLGGTSPSRRWELVSRLMSHGELGPQDTVSELRGRLAAQQGVRGFVVDGFPRDVHQALSFQEQVGRPDLVLLLLCSDQTLRCRLQRRAATLGLLGDGGHALQRCLDTFHRDIVSIVDADRDEDVVFADLSSVIKEKLFEARKD